MISLQADCAAFKSDVFTSKFNFSNTMLFLSIGLFFVDALWKLAMPNAIKLKINNGICHAVRHLLWRFLIGSVLFQSFILIKFEAIPRN